MTVPAAPDWAEFFRRWKEDGVLGLQLGLSLADAEGGPFNGSTNAYLMYHLQEYLNVRLKDAEEGKYTPDALY